MELPTMKIIDRYILTKFFTTYLFMVVVITTIICVIDFSENLDRFIEHKTPWSAVFQVYYPSFIVFLANILSPICIFLAVIFFTSAMAQKMEIVAILSSGISFYRFLAPYLATAALLTVVIFYLHAYLAPQAFNTKIDFEYQYLKHKRLYEAINIHKKIGKNTYAYMYNYDQYQKIGYMFTIEEFQNSSVKKKISARQAQFLDSLKIWRLSDVVYRTFSSTQETFRFMPQFDTALVLYPDDIYQKEFFTDCLPLDQLTAFIEREKERSSELIYELEVEKYERYAFPFATIILTLMGVAVSCKKSKGGIALQLGIGIALSFTYIFILVSAQVIGKEILPPWFAVWLPNLLFFIIALILIFLAPK
ncbi:MAG: LptF/LptG family permease [Bacteroidia bacterium]|nr:LptF/LptG family permease [Bacteroidia bacterium]MDW8158090.1 LptF/LptG family permease [Bacteroidia bacterium]